MNIPEPSQEEWDQAGNDGEDALCKALSDIFLKYNDSGKPLSLIYPIVVGSLVACGEFLQTIARPEAITEVELTCIAYLRGAIRGAEHPVNEDGSPFQRDLAS